MKADNLPCNLEAERKVLGAMIRDRDAVMRAQDWLSPADFYQPSHQIIYKAILEVHNAGTPVDLVILGAALDQKGELEQAGGPL
jgi:replicative DNA helicase